MTPTTATIIAGILAVVSAGCISAIVAIVAAGGDDEAEETPPTTTAPAPDPERRRLAPDWADLIRMPDVPELRAPALESQAALVRPYVEYVGRHQEDTVDLARVAPDWMPPVGAARLRAAVTETAEMDISEVTR